MGTWQWQSPAPLCTCGKERRPRSVLGEEGCHSGFTRWPWNKKSLIIREYQMNVSRANWEQGGACRMSTCTPAVCGEDHSHSSAQGTSSACPNCVLPRASHPAWTSVWRLSISNYCVCFYFKIKPFYKLLLYLCDATTLLDRFYRRGKRGWE